MRIHAPYLTTVMLLCVVNATHPFSCLIKKKDPVRYLLATYQRPLIGAGMVAGIYGLQRLVATQRAKAAYAHAHAVIELVKDQYSNELSLLGQPEFLKKSIIQQSQEADISLQKYFQLTDTATAVLEQAGEQLQHYSSRLTQRYIDFPELIAELAAVYTQLHEIKKYTLSLIAGQLCANVTQAYQQELNLIGQELPGAFQTGQLKPDDMKNETIGTGLDIYVAQQWDTPDNAYPFLLYCTELATTIEQLEMAQKDISKQDPVWAKIKLLRDRLRIIMTYIVLDEPYNEEKESYLKQQQTAGFEQILASLGQNLEALTGTTQAIQSKLDQLDERLSVLEHPASSPTGTSGE